jgi:hypothetical protein
MSTYRQFFGGGITDVETFAGDDVTTTFSPTTSITYADHIVITVNGLIQQPITHYTLSAGDIVFNEAPSNNAIITLQILNTSSAIPPSPALWDATINATEWTVSGGGNTATKIADSNLVVASITESAKTTGKWYAEFFLDVWTSGTTAKFGVIGSTFNITVRDVGSTADSWSILNDGRKYHDANASSYDSGLATADNATIMLALDKGAGRIWWGKNGTWGASGNPETGTNPGFTDADLIGNTVRLAASHFLSGRVVILRADVSSCIYTPPSGYDYWTSA